MTNIKLNIFDAIGDYRYKAVVNAHLRNALGVLICIDLSLKDCFSEDSFNLVEETIG